MLSTFCGTWSGVILRKRLEIQQLFDTKSHEQYSHRKNGGTLPETNSKFAPENWPFHPIGKACIPTIYFQGAFAVSFREGTLEMGEPLTFDFGSRLSAHSPSWESKGTPPMPTPARNKALLRDY